MRIAARQVVKRPDRILRHAVAFTLTRSWDVLDALSDREVAQALDLAGSWAPHQPRRRRTR